MDLTVHIHDRYDFKIINPLYWLEKFGWAESFRVVGKHKISLILLVAICFQQQSAIAQSAKNTAESPIKEIQAPESAGISPKLAADAKNLSPRISFEKTVCDLGDVGQGTKNTCEFKFTNTGQTLLKIGKIKRTCG